MAKIIRIPSAYVLETKVVGVSHQNPDGSSRQQIIAENVRENDRLLLKVDENNPHDEHAVGVFTLKGLQIGYLNREVAPRVKSAILNDATVLATVTWISDREIKGVGLRIELVN